MEIFQITVHSIFIYTSSVVFEVFGSWRKAWYSGTARAIRANLSRTIWAISPAITLLRPVLCAVKNTESCLCAIQRQLRTQRWRLGLWRNYECYPYQREEKESKAKKERKTKSEWDHEGYIGGNVGRDRDDFYFLLCQKIAISMTPDDAQCVAEDSWVFMRFMSNDAQCCGGFMTVGDSWVRQRRKNWGLYWETKFSFTEFFLQIQ